MRVRWLSLVLTVLLCSNAVAQGPSPSQSEAKMAADMAAMDCESNHGMAQGVGSNAAHQLDAANDVRAQCVAAGATPAQLAPGDANISNGNGFMSQGITPYNAAQAPHTDGDTHYAIGNAYWTDQQYAAACGEYAVSTPAHNTAAGKYWDAYILWDYSLCEYQQATMAFEVLLMMLQMP